MTYYTQQPSTLIYIKKKLIEIRIHVRGPRSQREEVAENLEEAFNGTELLKETDDLNIKKDH